MALRKEDMDNKDDRAEQKTKRTRITFDVSSELRRRIKLAALQEDLSISDYLTSVLEMSVPKEGTITQRKRHPVTRKTLEGLREVREEISRSRGGKPFEDSTEMIRQMREERTRQLMGEL